MEENSKASVTLVDLVRLFQKKFVLMVVIALVVGIIGGVCGGYLSVRGTVYSAEMEINVSPTDGSNEILHLLRSGRFAEQMLLEENGLPPKDQCNAEDYAAAEKLLRELEEIRAQRVEKAREFSRHYVSDVEYIYKAKSDEYNNILTLLKMYKEAQADALVSDAHEAMIAAYEEKLAEAETSKKEYYDNYYAPTMEKKYKLEIELARLTDQMTDKKQEADAAVEKIMSSWRQRSDVSGGISVLMNYVSYEHHVLEEETAKNGSNKVIESGYILVRITVPASAVPASYASGEAYVQSLVDRLEVRLPVCLRNFLEEDADVYEAKCVMTNPLVRISRAPGGMMPAAVQYGVISAVAGAVLAYIFFALQLVLKREEAYRAKADASEAAASESKAEKK